MREMMLRTAQFKNIKTKGKGLAIIFNYFLFYFGFVREFLGFISFGW